LKEKRKISEYDLEREGGVNGREEMSGNIVKRVYIEEGANACPPQ
jgi:hypothetical protein